MMAKRTIHVAAGRSHKRTIDAPTDKLALPIVERMTRSHLAKLPRRRRRSGRRSR